MNNILVKYNYEIDIILEGICYFWIFLSYDLFYVDENVVKKKMFMRKIILYVCFKFLFFF